MQLYMDKKKQRKNKSNSSTTTVDMAYSKKIYSG